MLHWLAYEKSGLPILRVLEEHSIAERRTSHLHELPAHHRRQARKQESGQASGRHFAHAFEIDGGLASRQLGLATPFR
jgi:hypothetical protein